VVLVSPVFVPLALYGGAEAADDLGYLFGLLDEWRKSLVWEIATIQTDEKLRAEFGAGGVGRGEELVEFGGVVALKAFGDVGHDRDGGPLYLARKPKVAGKPALASDLVDG
jgi:hypothetical protein